MVTEAPYKVLLVNAPVLGVLEPWYDSPDFGRPSLAYIAAYLREHDNFSIQIIDAKLEKLGFNEVLERALLYKPQIIGFTAFTNEIKPCAYQAALIKEKLPEAIMVVGGPHLTALPADTLREFPSFDIGVVGDGEVTFLELCRSLRQNSPIDQIAGLVYRHSVLGIKQTPFRTRIADQDSLPYPAWDLFPKANTYFVQASRGCPYQCVFCMNHNGRIARTRSVQQVVNEIRWILDTYQPEWIRFGDELWSVDIDRSCELLEALLAIGFGDRVKWDMTTHVNFVNDRLFELLKKNKVTTVEMGVETGDDQALKQMGKATNRSMILNAFEMAKKHGVPTGALLLLGQPNESIQSIRHTIDLAVEINADLPLLGIMVPFPGTEVAKMAAAGEGGYRLLSTNWDDYNKHPGNALEFTSISRTRLELLQMWGYVNIFLRNGRLVDMLRFLWTYRGAAWATLRKVMTPGRGVTDIRTIPADYDQKINAGAEVSAIRLIESRGEWNTVQVNEAKKYKLSQRKVLDS